MLLQIKAGGSFIIPWSCFTPNVWVVCRLGSTYERTAAWRLSARKDRRLGHCPCEGGCIECSEDVYRNTKWEFCMHNYSATRLCALCTRARAVREVSSVYQFHAAGDVTTRVSTACMLQYQTHPADFCHWKITDDSHLWYSLVIPKQGAVVQRRSQKPSQMTIPTAPFYEYSE